MNSHFYYLLIDLGCISVPLMASFYGSDKFIHHWSSFFKANIIVATIFIVWDIWFTKIGVWGFNPAYHLTLTIFGLPLEEILFFICIPYACVFTYFALRILLKRDPLRKINHLIIGIFMALGVIFSIVYYDKAYTFWTSLALTILCLFILKEKVNTSYMVLTYLIIFPFFILSNGILTGCCTPEPIVWYNNQENLGIRLGSIPIEDSLYGFVLIISNIILFEIFEKRKNKL